MAIAVRSREIDATGGTVYDRPLTWHDLQQFPDDGLRYELVDGVLLVWAVDPDADEPRLTVLRLDGDRYVEHAVVTGDGSYTTDEPVAVTVVPRELVEPYPPPG